MINAIKVNEAVNEIAPYELTEQWDNCGLLVDCAEETDKILFALDVTNEVVAEAKELCCGIIVSHHPAIFQGKKALADGDPVLTAAKEHISLIAAHTCFDMAQGGVNDVLCKILGVENASLFECGRGGILKKDSAKSLAEFVKEKLGCACVKYIDAGCKIEKVAIIGGSAGEFIGQAKWMGYDAFITGEIKHHEALFAKQIGLTVISAGHFETENPAMEAMLELVSEKIGNKDECLLSKKNTNPIMTI
ncbi:MAG: Nif3-like dinuclear metal center hexameric protein [Oscillospiraceae bacterium]